MEGIWAANNKSNSKHPGNTAVIRKKNPDIFSNLMDKIEIKRKDVGENGIALVIC